MKSLLTVLFLLFLVPLTTVLAGDRYVISDDDPLIFLGKKRLEKIINKLETRESIELLLGAGSENENSDVVSYMLIPDGFSNQHPGFVTHVLITYDQSGKIRKCHCLTNSLWKKGAKLNYVEHGRISGGTPKKD